MVFDRVHMTLPVALCGGLSGTLLSFFGTLLCLIHYLLYDFQLIHYFVRFDDLRGTLLISSVRPTMIIQVNAPQIIGVTLQQCCKKGKKFFRFLAI